MGRGTQTDRQTGGQAEGWPSPWVTQLGIHVEGDTSRGKRGPSNWTKGLLATGAVPSPGRRARVGYSALTAQASGSLAHPLTSEG